MNVKQSRRAGQHPAKRAVLVALGAAVTAVFLAVEGTSAMAAPTTAGPVVDPATLQPPPPPGTVCRIDGSWTICRRQSEDSWANVPIFDLRCGQIYETAVEARDARRWYSDGKLVKRHVVQDVAATWSLSPTGAGPTVDVSVHANWWVMFAVPGDESSGSLTAHGNFATVRMSGAGGELHIAGLELPDGTFRGVLRFVDDPEAVETLCTALAA
jgi:hypothetical protein